MTSIDPDELKVPADCARWCHERADSLERQLTVFEDGVQVDLDWWNLRLDKYDTPVRLLGRTLDDRIVSTGEAIIKRGDLRPESRLFVAGSSDLGLLYLCAAWLQGHPDRSVTRRFPMTSHPTSDPRHRFDCAADRLQLLREHAVGLDEWPDIPGAGVVLSAAFSWATDLSPSSRAQLIDKQGVAQLIHEGWLETTGVNDFTYRRYRRYVDVLNSWAHQASAPAELVELWLIDRWRTRHTRPGFGHPCPRVPSRP